MTACAGKLGLYCNLLFVVSNCMSSFERLLAPDCTDGPEYRCGEEMHIARVDEAPERIDAQIRIYKCSTCQHEMRLTVWAK